MSKDEALQLALEALKLWLNHKLDEDTAWEAHNAIKEALKIKDEPVAWGMEKDGVILDVICPAEHEREEGSYTVPLYTSPQIKTKDEPVALVAEVHISRYTIEWTNGPLLQGTKLYTTPQRKPLTDEHIDEIPFALFEQDQNGISATEALREFARAIEAAHGIKE